MNDIKEAAPILADTSVASSEKITVKNKRSGKSVSIGIVMVVLLLTGVAIGFYVHNNTPEKKYEKADKLFSEGQINEAIDIYTELADKQDYTKAQTRLAELYLHNDSVPLDAKKGIANLEKAYATDTVALKALMSIYQSDVKCKGTSLSNIEKLEYYAKYAIKNNKCLGYAYFHIGGVNADKKNYSLAYYYWKKAAKYGESAAAALANLGWLFYNGNGCEQDDYKARCYFEKAIEKDKDDDYSLFYLGEIYKNGYGVPIDINKAKDFYKRSAELGNEDAQKAYADMELKR